MYQKWAADELALRAPGGWVVNVAPWWISVSTAPEYGGKMAKRDIESVSSESEIRGAVAGLVTDLAEENA